MSNQINYIEDWLYIGDRSGNSRRYVDSDRERLKELEQENRELKMINVKLRKALAYFAQAELDRRSK